MSESGAHILVFPFPAQGHMIPLLDFTHQLASSGFTITILVAPKNLPLLNPLITAHPTISTLILPLLLPHTAVENIGELSVGGFGSMLYSHFRDLHDPLLHWFSSHTSPPVAIISDMFLGWTHHLACQLGICRYVFSPSGAFAFSLFSYLWCEMPKRKDCSDENEIVTFPKIPNSPIYPWWQLSPIYQSYVEGDPVLEFVKDSFRANVASYGLVFNTFSELEGVYLDYVMKESGHNRVWSIGPVLSPVARGGSCSIMVDKICSWLDTCQDRTVVYVCFGSRTVLTNKQLHELTLGLEKSRVKFILVVKDAKKSGHVEGDYGEIPLGFEDRVVGRGVVISGWAPQVEILRHRAVCAFFTHCGWNSIMESIVAGVPMMVWPMGADQFTNATLLVDQLNIAVRVCEGDGNVLDSDELTRFLVAAASEKWMERRACAMALSKTALDAVKGGSSYNNLDGFARHLSGK